MIRQADIGDMEDICSLYSSFMFDSYLLRFGFSFVQRYLSIVAGSKDCLSLVACENKVAGFIIASYNSAAILRRILCDPEIVLLFLKAVLRKPALLKGALGALMYPPVSCLSGVKAELLFIVVHPSWRGGSIAEELILETLSRMSGRGVKKIKVTTISANAAVNKLLNKLNFKLERKFMLLGKEMSLFSRPLATP